jgi:heparanase 1
LMAYTAGKGYPIAAWELGNELNIFWFVHGFKAQVSTGQYRQDLQSARALVNQYTPTARLAGQGSAIWPVLGEPLSLFYGFLPASLQASGSQVDQVSWHYYTQQSRRGPIASRRAFPARLLNPKNLDEAGLWADRMRAWRDAYAPGKPIWLGETGNAQFGGEPGLSDAYLSGLWWLDELGLLAAKDTRVVVRQTLSGMNYGMIDDATLQPRPDFWYSLLWKRLMGQKVYRASVEGSPHLRAYAQSTPSQADGTLTVLLINLDPQSSAQVTLPGWENLPYDVYEVNGPDLFGQDVLLNGQALKIGEDLQIPPTPGASHSAAPGTPLIQVHPLSYTFVTLPRK